MVNYKHIDCPELNEFNFKCDFDRFTEEKRADIEDIMRNDKLSTEDKNLRLQQLVKSNLGDEIHCNFHQIPLDVFGGLDSETLEVARRIMENIPPEVLQNLPPHVRDMLGDILGPQQPF